MQVSPAQNPNLQRQKNDAFVSKAVSLALILCVTCMPELALAQTGNPLENMLNGVISFFTSGVMRSVAILAVFSLGIAAYLGKISWELVMKIGGGIVLTFGGAALVDQFSGYV